MYTLIDMNNNLSTILNELELNEETCNLAINEFGENPSLYTVVTTFYRYGIYNGLDLLYDKFKDRLFSDNFMESIFLFLAKLGDEEKIEYFYTKNKDSINNRDSFDKFSQYNNSSTIEGIVDYSNPEFTPIFNEGLKVLCTKKKVHILKNMYSKGFKASLSQLKVATRSLNEDVFYIVFNELNRELIADYVPTLVGELCYYSKLEPIKFLFEKIGVNYISQESLNKCLLNSVNGHSRHSKLDIFKYILSLGASISYNNYEVFEKIFGYGHSDILEFLYEQYLDSNDLRNYDFKNCVELAIKYNKDNVISFLIKNNIDIDNNYSILDNKELIEFYCSQFNKNKEVMEYIINEISQKDTLYLNELKLKFPRQRKLQEFIKKLEINGSNDLENQQILFE